MASAAPTGAEADEMAPGSIHVDMAHPRIGHGAARIVGGEPLDDRRLLAGRCVEVDRPAVSMLGRMAGPRNDRAGAAGGDDPDRPERRLDAAKQAPRIGGEAGTRGPAAVSGDAKAVVMAREPRAEDGVAMMLPMLGMEPAGPGPMMGMRACSGRRCAGRKQ
jgi:hypothetical protein